MSEAVVGAFPKKSLQCVEWCKSLRSADIPKPPPQSHGVIPLVMWNVMKKCAEMNERFDVKGQGDLEDMRSVVLAKVARVKESGEGWRLFRLGAEITALSRLLSSILVMDKKLHVKENLQLYEQELVIFCGFIWEICSSN